MKRETLGEKNRRLAFEATQLREANAVLVAYIDDLRLERKQFEKEIAVLRDALHVPYYRDGKDILMHLSITGGHGGKTYHLTELMDEAVIQMSMHPTDVMMRHIHDKGHTIVHHFLSAQHGVVPNG